MDCWMDGQMDGWMNGTMLDGWMDVWIDGQMDELMTSEWKTQEEYILMMRQFSKMCPNLTLTIIQEKCPQIHDRGD